MIGKQGVFYSCDQDNGWRIEGLLAVEKTSQCALLKVTENPNDSRLQSAKILAATAEDNEKNSRGQILSYPVSNWHEPK